MSEKLPQGKERGGGSISDHLANERTYLAWIRTSIGIMAFGFVVVKFALFVKQVSLVLQKPLANPGHGYSSVIGIALVGFGALLAVFSYARYRITARQIRDASFVPPLRMIALLSAGVILMGILLVIYLINSVGN